MAPTLLSETPFHAATTQCGENTCKNLSSNRNPLLYPVELRAQFRSEVAASEYDVQVFPSKVE
jgi:hypothetical protein